MSSQFKILLLWENPVKRVKKQVTDRKYLQTTKLEKDLYLESIKNSQNSTVKRQSNQKMGKIHEEIFH